MSRVVVVGEVGRDECPGKLRKRNIWREGPSPPSHIDPLILYDFSAFWEKMPLCLCTCVQNYAKPTFILLFLLVALPGIFKELL